MYDYIFFDLDGTLTRSGEGIKKSAAHAIAQLGYPALTEAQLDSFVGPPLLESFRTLCGMDEETALRAVAIYRARFEDVGWRENAVYPGIAPLLRALRAAGKHVSIVTAKPERFAVRIAEYFGIWTPSSASPWTSITPTRRRSSPAPCPMGRTRPAP